MRPRSSLLLSADQLPQPLRGRVDDVRLLGGRHWSAVGRRQGSVVGAAVGRTRADALERLAAQVGARGA